MVEHDRIPMPFERARTQLLLGRIQRRQRQEQAATASLTEARRVFERLGTPLSAARARRCNGPCRHHHHIIIIIIIIDTRRHELAPSEQKVARLTASGMANGEVAATLIISPKTVEFP